MLVREIAHGKILIQTKNAKISLLEVWILKILTE